MVCASALFLSVCMSLSPSPIPSNCDSACLSVSVRYTSVRLDNRPSELHAEMTPHQHPILRLVSTRSPFRVAAPAPDFRRSWRAGSPRGRLPSAPLPGGRDPSPLTSPAPPPGADISGGPAEQRVLASGFLRALPTHCLQTLKLGTQQPQDPGPVPQSSRRTGNHPCPSAPAGGVRKGRPSPPTRRETRGRRRGICAKVGRCAGTAGSSHRAATLVVVTAVHSGPGGSWTSDGRLATPGLPGCQLQARARAPRHSWAVRAWAREPGSWNPSLEVRQNSCVGIEFSLRIAVSALEIKCQRWS